jgi:hypothetical protein
VPVVLQIAEAGQSARNPLAPMSYSDPVNLVYEPDLAGHIALRQPADLTFSDHVHRLVSGDRVQRSAVIFLREAIIKAQGTKTRP